MGSSRQLTTDLSRRTVRELPASSGDETSAFSPPKDPLAETAAADRIVAGTGHTPVTALGETLRFRVGAVLPLAAGIWGTILLLGLTGIDPMYRREVIGIGGLAVIAVAVTIWVVGTVWVWSRKEWPVSWLRGFEMAILLPHAASLVVMRVLQYRAAFAGRGIEFLTAVTVHNGFGWLAALVAWGLVFPHPWRRVLAINLSLVACPLLVDFGLILAEPARLPAMLYPAVLTGQMLAFGLVMSLFGSHRVSALQAEVASVRAEIRAARKLGPYTLIRRLGGGGMGEVFLAEHRLLKRPCAVKLIRPDRAADPRAQARFDREVQATARLKHPNTVDVFDYGRTDDGTFYYVMEYLDGLSLDEVVRRQGPLPPGRAVYLLKQLCGALPEAHAHGLVHRDIKPSNVLLCRHGGLFDVVKLVDFGLVHDEAIDPAASHLTQAGTLTGTPDYVSPEQAAGTRADHRTDLYSLGATAYFLLCARPPYTGATVLDILFAHRYEPVRPLAGPDLPIPANLEAIVTRLLAKAPEDRYPSAEAVETALLECVGLEPWSEHQARSWWESFGSLASGAEPDPTSILPGGVLESGGSASDSSQTRPWSDSDASP